MEFGGLTINVPAGYQVRESDTQEDPPVAGLLRLGGCPEAAPPLSTLDKDYVDSWLKYDQCGWLKLRIVELPAGDTTSAMSDLARRFHNGFSGRWGPQAFSHFDDDRQIGHSANLLGAFIAAHIGRCRTRFVVVEAMDVIEFLKLTDAGFERLVGMDNGAKWRAVRAAANTEDAEALIANVCKAVH
jgi:hypothetical protein